MQDNPEYDDVVADILKWFSHRIVKLAGFRCKGYNH